MRYSILKFKRNEQHTMRDLEKLRGFLIDRYSENSLFHNHLDGGFDYSYPKLQYKLIKNTLALMAIEEIEYINEKLFQEIEYLNIDDNLFFDFEKELEIFETDIGETVHNLPEMTEKRREYKQMREYALRKEMERKQQEMDELKKRMEDIQR